MGGWKLGKPGRGIIRGKSITVKEFLLVHVGEIDGHPVVTRFGIRARVGYYTPWEGGNLGRKLVAGKDTEKARGRYRVLRHHDFQISSR